MRKMSKMKRIICLLLAMSLLGFAGCGGSKSSQNKPKPPNPPDPPVPLTSPQAISTTGLDGKLLARWTKNAAAQGIEATYEIWINTMDNTGTAVKVGNLLACAGMLCEAEIPTLVNGVTYYVWVKAAYGSLGTADFSPTFSGMPVPVPATPAGLTITPGENQLNVEWSARPYAFSYDVSYSDNLAGNNAQTIPVTTTAAVITTFGGSPLENGKEYYVQVRAVNTAGESNYTAPVSGVPIEAVYPPPVPGSLTVNAGFKRLSVTWDNISDATEYKIYRNTVNNSATATLYGAVPSSIPNVTANITGLTNGVTYYVWVKASNSQGDSSFSPVGTGMPQEKAPPVNYGDVKFILGEAGSDYIFAEVLPLATLAGRPSGSTQDRLTRVKETPLGNLFTDGAAWYAREVMGVAIDFVFLNGGFIDQPIPTGTIKLGDFETAVASADRTDTFTFVTLKGSDVIELFDDAAKVRHTGAGTGGNPSTSLWAIVSEDVSYTLLYKEVPPETDPSVAMSNAESEQYIIGTIKPGTLKINGVAIDPNREYRIATTSYLAAGAYYTELKVNRVAVMETTIPFWHGIAEYIYDHGTVTPSFPANNDECRITIEGGAWLGALNENICNFRTHR